MFLHKFIVKAALLSLGAAPALALASVIGFLGNFDVVNDTGKEANGFEIDLEGLHKTDITDVFGGAGRGFPTGRGYGSGSVERYGAPSIVEYSNGSTFGTKVTYFGLYSSASGSWDFSTPSTTAGHFVTPGDNCWSGGGLGYGAGTPCDHFGVGARANATKTTYSWLYGDNTGTLTSAGGTVSLPAPAWNVIPAPAPAPGQPLAPPVVVAQVQAPAPVQPLENPEPQWGQAIWVKVFTTELDKPVGLEELVGDNAKVKQAKTETEWQLLQTDPGNPLSGQLESGYGAPVGLNAASILRRYEFYKFGGVYDVTDNHAILTGTDSAPSGTDVGNYIGAQNAGVNLGIAAVPEPESYAMLLAGLSLMGAMARRKSK
jgi:hypothetical protein